MRLDFRSLAPLFLALSVAMLVGLEFSSQRDLPPLRPAPGFAQRRLSDYFEPLKGTPADAPVFVAEGGRAGASVLVMGGVHPNEPAGHLAAVLLVERAAVRAGRLFVLPYANPMGFSHTQPQEASPPYVRVRRPDGSLRAFKYGSRLTNPIHQWPDPTVYLTPVGGQAIAGSESRNLNRCFPGRPDGNLTERLAYAITELIREEGIDLVIDLHEASPEYPVINAMVAHPRAMELASVAVMAMQMRGIKIGLEVSPANLRGLSHRELGDATRALVVLMETGNPSQGRLRGRTDEALVLTGADKAYRRAHALGRLFVPYDEGRLPLELRVGRHLEGIRALLESLRLLGKEVSVEGIPSLGEILDRGLGSFL